MMNETNLRSKAADMEVAHSSPLGMMGNIESVGLAGSGQTLQRGGESLLDKQLAGADKSRLHRDKHPALKPLRCQAAELQRARVTGSLKHPLQRSGEVSALTGNFELYGVPMGATSDPHRKIVCAGGTRSLTAKEHDRNNALHELWISKQWKLPPGTVNPVRTPTSDFVPRRSPHIDGHELQHVSRLTRSASDPATSTGPLHDAAKLGMPRIAVEQVREERLRSATLLAASRANDLAAGPSSVHSSQQTEKRPLASLLQQLEIVALADA